MTQEQLNEQFKTFFTDHGFKVRRECEGMKATNEDVDLTFYIGYDMFSKHYHDKTGLDSRLWAKIPYTHYEVVNYEFALDTISGLDVIFTDPEFLKLLEFKLPKKINKILN